MSDTPVAGAGLASPAAVRPQPVQETPFPWWTLLVVGLATMVFGAAVLIWPEPSVKVMAWILGIWLLLAGVTRLISAFLPRGGLPGQHVLSGIVGVVLIVGGVVCLRNLEAGAGLIAIMVALSWLLSGISEIVVGLQTSGGSRVAMVTLGVLSMIAGMVFLVVPRWSLVSLVLMTGISALVVGLVEVVSAVQLRKVRA